MRGPHKIGSQFYGISLFHPHNRLYVLHAFVKLGPLRTLLAQAAAEIVNLLEAVARQAAILVLDKYVIKRILSQAKEENVKSIILALTGSVCLIIPACSAEPATRDQYVQLKDILYVNSSAPNPAAQALDNMIRNYEGKRTQWSKEFRAQMLVAARKACDSLGVRFASFDVASKNFGVVPMKFTEKLDAYIDLIPSVTKAWDEGGALPSQQDEYMARMEYDLGLSSPQILVEVSEEGTIKIDGISAADSMLGAELGKLFRLTSNHSLHFLCDSLAPTGRLFDVIEATPPFEGLPNISPQFSVLLHIFIWPGNDYYKLADFFTKPSGPGICVYRGPFPGAAALVELDAAGGVFLGSRSVASGEELKQSVTQLLRQDTLKRAIIAADAEIPFWRVLGIVRILDFERSGIGTFYLVRREILKQKDSQPRDPSRECLYINPLDRISPGDILNEPNPR